MLKPYLLTPFLVLACNSPDWPNTANQIRYAAIFDYAMTPSPNYSFVWGAGEREDSIQLLNQDAIALTRSWHQANPNAIISRYIPFTRDPDASRGPTGYWQREHPSWILYRCDRVTPAWEFDDTLRHEKMPLDLSNPDVLTWQLQNYVFPAERDGYDAIALDNFSLNNTWRACGIWRNGEWTRLYSGKLHDPAYAATIISWLRRLRDATPLFIIPNWHQDPRDYKEPTYTETLSLIDAILDEEGFYHHNAIIPNLEEKIAQIKYVQTLGKAYIIINQLHGHYVSEVLSAYHRANLGKAYIYLEPEGGYGHDTFTSSDRLSLTPINRSNDSN